MVTCSMNKSYHIIAFDTIIPWPNDSVDTL